MDYDNVGLLVGNPDTPVTNILTCLDVTEEIVEEAIQKGCNLIVAHHPLIFTKIGRLWSNPSMLQELKVKMVESFLDLLLPF